MRHQWVNSGACGAVACAMCFVCGACGSHAPAPNVPADTDGGANATTDTATFADADSEAPEDTPAVDAPDATADVPDAMDAAVADAVDAADVSLDAEVAADVADAADANQPGWYDPSYLPQIDLAVDATAMAVLMDPSLASQKTWVHAAFASEGVTLSDVGLRRKGASTYRVVPQKAAFKVKFNKWVKGQKFRGYTDLTLNNMVDDATGLRERLSYYVYRSLGIPAPQCNTAIVTLNGESYGPYANIETPDSQMMTEWFGTKSKSLYEVDAGSQWLPGSEVGFLVDVGDGTKADALALFNAVAAAKDDDLIAGVQAVLDVTEWLRYCGVEAATGQFDHYAYGLFGSHNYFMAGDTDGVMRMLPWSTDLSFSDDKGVLDASNPLPADPVYGGKTLLQRCKLSQACWDAYRAQVANVLADYEKLNLVDVAKTWHAQIDAAQAADTKREASLDYYVLAVPQLYDWIKARPGIVKQQLDLP